MFGLLTSNVGYVIQRPNRAVPDTGSVLKNYQFVVLHNILTRRVHGDRVTDFFKLCEIKVSLCSKKVTKAYDPLFRNTRENCVKTRDDICSVSYSLFCASIQKVRCGRAVIDSVHFSGDVSGSDRDIGFFFNFVLRIFKYHFCFCFLVSVFLILLIFCVKFTYSINRKLYFVSCLIQLTKLCVNVFSGL